MAGGNNGDDDDDNDEELYDEFGNYIGPELDDSSSDEEESDDDKPAEVPQAPDDASEVSGEDPATTATSTAMVIDGNHEQHQQHQQLANPMNAIVLHEDKEHYASAEQTFGEGVRTAVLDEDAMELDTPLVEPVLQKSHHVDANDGNGNPFLYSDDYLTTIISNETTRTRRGVALIGHLHHGKTSLVDCLMEPTMVRTSTSTSSTATTTTGITKNTAGPKAALEDQGVRYTDFLKSEQDRQLSLVSTPLTLLLPDTRGKTYGMTLVDCPGHVQFHDESVAALRTVDGAVLVVDAVEGLMMHSELLVKQAVSEGLPLTLVISKVDRLICELKLPPRDAYYKLLQIIESTNEVIAQASCGRYPALSPGLAGNVCFSSALHGWLFTLPSFAKVYAEHHENLGNVTTDQLAERLWGDYYWDPSTKTFHTSAKECATRVERTFCTFVLEPLYKIYAACLGEREEDANALLRSLGVLLKKEQLRASARPLLRAAMSKFMETAACGFVDMVVQHV
jgi:U5 small nuclear ribonucleoprotein component